MTDEAKENILFMIAGFCVGFLLTFFVIVPSTIDGVKRNLETKYSKRIEQKIYDDDWATNPINPASPEGMALGKSHPLGSTIWR